MNLFKTSALNGIAVLIRTASMFVLNKILAIYVGPSGYAAIGQFQNFIHIVTTFAGGAINTAVVKYTAEYYYSDKKQKLVWKTAGTIVLIFSMIVTFLILIFQKQLAIYIFKSTEYQSIFIWLAFFLVFFNFNALFLAILNGKKEILRLVIANIAGSLFSLIITGLLAYKLGLYGALVAVSINQSIVFLVTLFLCYRANWFKLTYLFGKIDKALSKKFSSYILMALTTALCVPLSQILIRSHISHEFGPQYAGYWEAIIKLSSAYLMLITTTLSVYYLPKLSELRDFNSIKREVYIAYKLIFPVALIGALSVYALKDWIIKLLFTESFLPMRELFLWQMMGDSLKIGSWIVGYLMLGQAMTKLFIISEITASLSLIIFTYICTKVFGFEGVSIAYLINYAFYWLFLSPYVFKELRSRYEKKL